MRWAYAPTNGFKVGRSEDAALPMSTGKNFAVIEHGGFGRKFCTTPKAILPRPPEITGFLPDMHSRSMLWRECASFVAIGNHGHEGARYWERHTAMDMA
jgi:hypothetical protein